MARFCRRPRAAILHTPSRLWQSASLRTFHRALAENSLSQPTGGNIRRGFVDLNRSLIDNCRMKISSRRCIAVLACLALPMIPACSQKKTGGPAQWTAGSLEFFRAIPENADDKYVHMMHLDGFRPDLFKALLDAN